MSLVLVSGTSAGVGCMRELSDLIPKAVTPFPKSPTNDLGPGTSLVVQWLTPHAPKAGGPGSIPDQGTRSHMLQLRVLMPQLKTWCRQVKKAKNRPGSVPGPPHSPTHTTHQAIPRELEEVEAVHTEADVLPKGGHGHNGLGVVPGHVIVDVP